MAARCVFHCSVNVLLLMSIYILVKPFLDENVPHSLVHFRTVPEIDRFTVGEVRQHGPPWSVLVCWYRHFEFCSFSCKRRARFSKSRISYYRNSTASLNYEYLRLCGDINPNPGPTSRKADAKCLLCLMAIHKLTADKCGTCGLLYHKRCGGKISNNTLDKRYYTCASCLLHQQNFPFMNTSNMDESLSETLVHINDTMVGDATELNALGTARRENPRDLLLSHLNINSIQNKFEELRHIVLESRVQIMVVSKSKVDASYPDSQFHIPGYHLHRQDRKKGGGGVLMLVSSKIESRRIKIDRKYKTIEIIALHIALTTRNLILLAIYRPPKKVTAHYQLLLEEELSHVSNWDALQNQFIFIIGDLNLNRMNPDSAEGKTLLNLEIEQGLECLITLPTRVQMQGACVTRSLIDVILTNQPDLFRKCGVYNPEISDHALIYGFIKVSRPNIEH